MLCFVRLGVSLTYGILCSVGAAVGVVMPMIFKASGVFGQGPDIFSPTGLVILAGAAILVVGVAFASLAGANREQTKNLSTANDATAGRGNFAVGLIMVIVAGVLSTGWGFAFTYSQDPIIAAMKARGASDIPANIAVWAIALLGATVPNVLYPVFLLTKNRSWSVLASKPSEIFLSAVYGVLFFAPSILLGIGMLRLGDRGASVGWGLVQGTLILGGQLLGFASGEWRGVAGKPRLQIYAAILILIAAMIVMASAKSNDAKALPEKATAESHLNGAS
jgi:L-rhamnose-H+ transport protein